jgi:hypothetical protein
MANKAESMTFEERMARLEDMRLEIGDIANSIAGDRYGGSASLLHMTAGLIARAADCAKKVEEGGEKTPECTEIAMDIKFMLECVDHGEAFATMTDNRPAAVMLDLIRHPAKRHNR